MTSSPNFGRMHSIDTVDVDGRPGAGIRAPSREFIMGIILASIQLVCFAALATIALIVAARSTNDDDKE